MRQLGLDVVEAQTAEKARAWIESSDPALVLISSRVSEHAALCRSLKEKSTGRLILLCDAEAEQFAKEGSDGFFVEPVDDRMLVEYARASLRARDDQREEAHGSERLLRLFRHAITQASDLIAFIDIDGRYVYVSPSLCAATRYSSTELLARRVPDVDKAVDMARFRQLVEALREGPLAPFETRFRRKDGSSFSVEISASLVEFDGQNFICGVARDLTARSQAQETLRETEELLSLAEAAAGVGIWNCDLHTGAATLNAVCYKLFGLPRAPQGYRELFGLAHPDDASLVNAQWEEALAGEGKFSVDYRIIRANDGAVRWMRVEGQIIFDIGGQPQNAMGAVYDITERREVDEALRLSEARERARAADFDAIMTAAPAALWIAHDPECHHITGNPEVYRMTRMPEGSNVTAWAPDPSKLPYRFLRNGALIRPEELPMQLAVAKGGEIRDTELTFERFDGEQHQLFGHAAPLYDEAGRVRGAIGAFLDVTALKRAQAALEEADRLKDEFLAMLSHELRNPLASISNALRILTAPAQYRSLTEEDNDKLLQMMQRQTKYLVRLVDELLEASRITRGKIELQTGRIDLADVLREAVESSRSMIEQSEQKIFAFPASALPIDGDRVRLVQVFVNLLNNANKYTQPGGSIWIEAKQSDGEAVVSISDNGRGIPQDMLPKVFDRFVQINPTGSGARGGLGLGLALVRSLVELHGGSVEALSEGEGEGSTFRVRLPLVSEVAVANTTEEKACGVDNFQKRVLVIDDDRDVADSLAMLLQSFGAVVEVAYGGAAGLDAFDSFQPDLVLLDLGMPGMDGFETARHIRERPVVKHFNLVALTGWGQARDRLRTREAGFDHHLLKPLDLAQLQHLLSVATTTKDLSASPPL